jgi:purine-binding chemotaxis protein CheW
MSETMQYCTFSMGELFFGVDVEKVQEVTSYHEMTRAPLAPAIVRGLINLRGQIVTAIDLRCLLNLGEYGSDEKPMNIFLRSKEGVVSFLVDEIGDVLDVDEKTFEAPPESLQGVAGKLIDGAYKLEGRLLLALDADKAIEIATQVKQ